MNGLIADNVSRTRLSVVLLCIVSGLVLVLFRAEELSGMSTGYASNISNGAWYFGAHHLLYQPITKIIADILGLIGCDTVCAGQSHSIVWALAAVASIFIIIQRLTGSIATGLITAIFFLGTRGFLTYATQLEPYVPMIGAHAVIAAILLTRIERPLLLHEIAVIIGLYILSLFFHQESIFYLIPITVTLGLAYGRDGLWIAFWIAFISGIVALSANALIFWNLYPHETFGDFYRWLMYYAVISNDTHGSWQQVLSFDFGRLFGAARETVNAFVEVPDFGMQKPLRLLFFSGVAIAMIWNAAFIRNRAPHRNERLFFLTWAIVFGAFGYWWHPYVYKFYIVLLMPLTALCALMVHDILRQVRSSTVARWSFLGLLMTVMLSVVGANVSGSAWSVATSQSPIYSLSQRLSEAAPQDCSLYSVRSMQGVLGYRHQRMARPFNLMFLKYKYQSVNPDAASTIRVSIDMESEDCAVIPLYWLSEEYYNSRKRTIRVIDSGDDPGVESPQWVEFIGWMLNSRKDSNSDGISYHPFTVFLHENEAYVRIDRTRRSFGNSPVELTWAINDAVESNPLGGYAGDEFSQTGKFRVRAFGYF